MNKAYIAGHLGDDPKKRVIASGASAGQEVISFSVATKTRRAGQDETTWWNVTVWPDRAHLKGILKFLKKGSAVIVMGDMSRRTYVDKNGQTQFTVDITADSISFSPFNKAEGTTVGQSQEQQQTSAQSPFEGAFAFQQTPAPAAVGSSAFGQGADAASDDNDALPF